MPVGKNALKRVTNNGYSKVRASAPDMENSEIVNTEPKEAEEKLETVATVKASPKKNTAPKTKKAPVKKPEIKNEDMARPDGFIKYSFGQELPTYLL